MKVLKVSKTLKQLIPLNVCIYDFLTSIFWNLDYGLDGDRRSTAQLWGSR